MILMKGIEFLLKIIEIVFKYLYIIGEKPRKSIILIWERVTKEENFYKF